MHPKPEWWNTSIPEDQKIIVRWNSQHNAWWNELCADVIEVFGLPGNRFHYSPKPDFMTFTFKSKKDADLCKILLSDKV